MTGLLHEREFSRKTFLKGGGAMLVGFSVLGAGVGAKVAKAADDDPFASNGPYDQTAVDSWLIIHGDNTASLKVGKVEMGQGTTTALLIIAAEELNMDFKQMKIITHLPSPSRRRPSESRSGSADTSRTDTDGRSSPS
jgi:isoquinoline 1-oxidoreductase beta subunit